MRVPLVADLIFDKNILRGNHAVRTLFPENRIGDYRNSHISLRGFPPQHVFLSNTKTPSMKCGILSRADERKIRSAGGRFFADCLFTLDKNVARNYLCFLIEIKKAHINQRK